MADDKIIGYDIDGTEIISDVLNELLNSFPGKIEDIYFSVLEADGGTMFFPTSGAVIYKERESITGHVVQTCQYPFIVIKRAAPNTETQKIAIKEWLDSLGRWLEKQPVTIGGIAYALKEYPVLGEGRKITKIARTTPAYCSSATENGVEDWAISIFLQYTTEFER